MREPVTGFTDWISTITDLIGQGEELAALSEIWSGFKETIDGLVYNLADVVGGALAEFIGVDWPGAREGLAAFNQAMTDLWTIISTRVQMAIDTLTVTLNGWWASVATGVQAFMEGMLSTLQPVIDMINRILGGIQAIKDTFGAGGIAAQAVTALNESDMTFGEKAGVVLGAIGAELGIGRASGGPVSAGQPYIVGEQGPEWFIPSSGGTVLPHGTAPGGNRTIIINAYGESPYELARMIRNAERDMG